MRRAAIASEAKVSGGRLLRWERCGVRVWVVAALLAVENSIAMTRLKGFHVLVPQAHRAAPPPSPHSQAQTPSKNRVPPAIRLLHHDHHLPTKMKLLTTNYLTCAVKACRTSPLSFPLHFKDAELVQETLEVNPEFIRNILPRIEWPALVTTATEVCRASQRSFTERIWVGG